MQLFPSFRAVNDPKQITAFSDAYTRCSGFKVPRGYYESNKVFAVFSNDRMIGGFVLGSGESLRTLEVFAGSESRKALYEQVRLSGDPTEMCCFWIEPASREKTWLNLFVWGCVAYALQVHGRQRLIFGTNSARLAALYGAARKSELLHCDRILQKQTFIFTGRRSDCLLGVLQILGYKFNRLLQINRNNRRRLVQI